MNLDLPTPLVETHWLEDHLAHPDLRVIDATYMMPVWTRDAEAEFAEAHIPGAQFFDIDRIADPESDLPHMVPSPEAFAGAVGRLGIGSDHAVVAYDAHGLMSAARAWWMFRLFGHDRVAVLNGGLPKWRAEGRPIADSSAPLPPARFTPDFRPDLLRRLSHIQRRDAREQLVDARDAARFEGAEDLWPGRRAGHIPGARNLPFARLLNPADGVVLPEVELRRAFTEAGIDLSRPMTVHCGSGITACIVALAAWRLGCRDVSIYDGSWAEYGLPADDRPVATGSS